MKREHLPRRRILQIVASTAALGLAGCSGDDGPAAATDTETAMETETETEAEMETETEAEMETETEMAESTVTPGLSVSDQEAEDGSVTISSATIDAAGWLVVHPEAEGGGPNAGVTLAERQLAAGEHGDVRLTLDPLDSGEQTVYAMLHYDDPADGEFTFPDEGDGAVTVDGEPVVEPFAVAAGGGTPSTATVDVADFSFGPRRLSVEPGTTVEWVNDDPVAHDVTSAQFHGVAEEWDFQEDLPAVSEASYTFESPGIYEYYCSIHGDDSMCGVVLVGDASLDQELPCEGGSGSGGGY